MLRKAMIGNLFPTFAWNLRAYSRFLFRFSVLLFRRQAILKAWVRNNTPADFDSKFTSKFRYSSMLYLRNELMAKA